MRHIGIIKEKKINAVFNGRFERSCDASTFARIYMQRIFVWIKKENYMTSTAESIEFENVWNNARETLSRETIKRSIGARTERNLCGSFYTSIHGKVTQAIVPGT